LAIYKTLSTEQPESSTASPDETHHAELDSGNEISDTVDHSSSDKIKAEDTAGHMTSKPDDSV